MLKSEIAQKFLQPYIWIPYKIKNVALVVEYIQSLVYAVHRGSASRHIRIHTHTRVLLQATRIRQRSGHGVVIKKLGTNNNECFINKSTTALLFQFNFLSTNSHFNVFLPTNSSGSNSVGAEIRVGFLHEPAASLQTL